MKKFFSYGIMLFIIVVQSSFFQLGAASEKTILFPEGSIQKALSATVFIGIEHHPFEAVYGKDPGYYGILRPFYDFFYPRYSFAGSGFVINEEGCIVTNAHVVDQGTSFQVVFPHNGVKKLYNATLVGMDSRSDLAVLKIEQEGEFFPYLELASKDAVSVGESVFVCGNPIASCFSSSITAGIVSALNRNNFGVWRSIEGFMQIDAPINFGNSGGPVLNGKGEVVGVISWKNAHWSIEGMGFAIPIQTVEPIVKQLIEKGEIKEGYLGVGFKNEGIKLFDRFYFEDFLGVRIDLVVEDSAASQYLEEGDLIIEANGQKVYSPQSLKNLIGVLQQEDEVVLKVDRNGEILEFTLSLQEDSFISSWGEYLDIL